MGELQDISCKKPISVTKRISNKRVKGYMGNPEGLMQVLWECVFWTHPSMYVPITHYVDERIIMVTQFLKQV